MYVDIKQKNWNTTQETFAHDTSKQNRHIRLSSSYMDVNRDYHTYNIFLYPNDLGNGHIGQPLTRAEK